MAGLLEAAHELVEEHHLAGGHGQAVDGLAVVVGPAEVALRALEEEGVVAALLQLRDDVQQADLAAPLGALPWCNYSFDEITPRPSPFPLGGRIDLFMPLAI